jgi:hypothetical protein
MHVCACLCIRDGSEGTHFCIRFVKSARCPPTHSFRHVPRQFFFIHTFHSWYVSDKSRPSTIHDTVFEYTTYLHTLCVAHLHAVAIYVRFPCSMPVFLYMCIMYVFMCDSSLCTDTWLISMFSCIPVFFLCLFMYVPFICMHAWFINEN